MTMEESLAAAKLHIHSRLDSLWQKPRKNQWNRRELYKVIDKHLGYPLRIESLSSIEEARKVYAIIDRFYFKTKRCPF